MHKVFAELVNKMDFRSELVKAISQAGVEKELAEKILEVPSERAMGDFALPCFKLAAVMKKNPMEIAKEISAKIKLPKTFSRFEVKGAYINFFADEGKYAGEIISALLAEKKVKLKGKSKTIVEYCQANPMKAFHIGHVRNICLGESIARIIEESGKKVIRVDYGGDVGPHVSKTIYAYRELAHEKEPKELKEKEKWLGELYVMGAKAVKDNPALEEKMREMVVALEKGKDKQLKKDWAYLRKMSLLCFHRIFKDLGVTFDRIILESEVEKEGIKIAHQLHKEGFAVKDQGALLVDLTEHGLEKFLILKSDGAALYSSKDIALAKLKKNEMKAEISYYVVGGEQAFYFRQLIKTIELLNNRKQEYCPGVHISYELVRLEGGKMSSREGNVITYAELFDEVLEKTLSETRQRHTDWNEKRIVETARKLALAAIKFGMVGHDKNKVIVFNWEKATSLEGETGPFILYSFARARSILRKAGKFKAPAEIKISTEKEKRLVSVLGGLDGKITEARDSSSPHKIAHYLLGLASEFNSFYHEVPVLQAEKESMASRIAMVKAVSLALEKGMGLLNIEMLEEM